MSVFAVLRLRAVLAVTWWAIGRGGWRPYVAWAAWQLLYPRKAERDRVWDRFAFHVRRHFGIAVPE
jgi:hypothetical protein